MQKLKVLRAGAIAQHLSFTVTEDDIKVKKDVFLDKVLSLFFETRNEHIVITNDDGVPFGEITWDQFKRFAQFRKAAGSEAADNG